MGGITIDRYVRQQAEAVFRQYREGRFWIAVRDRQVLEKQAGCTIGSVKGWPSAVAFTARRRGGSPVELWCDPTATDHRAINLAFAATSVTDLSGEAARALDSDHAFPASAARERAKVYGAPSGFVRMSLIDSSANRGFGAGWENRIKHRIYSHGDHCVGNLADVLKAVGYRPEGGWVDPYRLMKDGVEHLRALGLIEQREVEALYRFGLKEFWHDYEASGTAYARQTGQL